MDPDELVRIAFVGIGATAIVDLWAIIRQRLLDVPLPNYGHVGRWLSYLARGRFRLDSIATTPPVSRERLIGWTAHYLIGIGFAVILVLIRGVAWLHEPTLAPALSVGIGTVLFPFLLMHPGMGVGIAASRSPRPANARIQSLATHVVFGVGLFLAARLIGVLYPN